MGAQRVGRNAPRAQRCEDFVEILPRRIAAAEQRRLALVKLGISEGDGIAHDADQDIGAAMGDIIEAGVHRLGAAGGVENAIEKFFSGQARQFGFHLRVGAQAMIDADFAPAKIEAILARVERGDAGSLQFGENHAGDADRPGADDENAAPRRQRVAADGMGADGEKFDHRRLIERDAFGADEIVFGHADIIGHAAVDVHAEHRQALAAIGLAAPAGDTGAAVEIGDDRDGLAGLEAAAGADRVDLAGEFMADDARIFEIGLRPLEYMQVGAANAGAAQPDARLARLQRRFWPFDDGEFAGFDAEQGSHRAAPSADQRARLRKNRSTRCGIPTLTSLCLLWIKWRHSLPSQAVFYGQKAARENRSKGRGKAPSRAQEESR
jgi:hypothetical protein